MSIESEVSRKYLRREFFGGQVSLVTTTMMAGNMSKYDTKSGRHVEFVAKEIWGDQVHRVLIQNPDFTRLVLRCDQMDATHRLDTDLEIIRSVTKCDGLITEAKGTALMVAPADCPTILIHNPWQKKMALLHGGLKCLLPRGGDIIKACLDAMGESSGRNCSISWGSGIGPCCYGHDPQSDIIKEVRQEYGSLVLGSVSKPPRQGQKSISLRGIIANLARYYRFHSEDWTWGGECTSCSGHGFYSHVRGHRERNAVIALLR